MSSTASIPTTFPTDIISPGMSNSELSGYVNESGYTYDTGWPGTNITYSYGKYAPHTNGANYVWGIYSSGIVNHDDFHGRSSYGNISPFMDSDDVVCTVWLDGGIYGNRPMVDNASYGRNDRRPRMVLITLGLFILLAASASALSLSSTTFPTGEFNG